ncbi:MAG: hypothetical protein B6D76_03580 [gamma proteobacterium symbiont of Stewartia floridana]|nr:MAG: hypothetical protein B6D76_03580 [gamma proteobacterium symbiont of Stewartia floridana]RLW58990.1 MAG: hypothetical protein B6D75_11980 [gamma proteobacterium symbiont of Stewartia floridana]
MRFPCINGRGLLIDGCLTINQGNPNFSERFVFEASSIDIETENSEDIDFETCLTSSSKALR